MNSRIVYIFSNSILVPPDRVRLRITKEPVEEGQNNDVVCSGWGGEFQYIHIPILPVMVTAQHNTLLINV